MLTCIVLKDHLQFFYLHLAVLLITCVLKGQLYFHNSVGYLIKRGANGCKPLYQHSPHDPGYRYLKFEVSILNRFLFCGLLRNSPFLIVSTFFYFFFIYFKLSSELPLLFLIKYRYIVDLIYKLYIKGQMRLHVPLNVIWGL